MIYTIICFLFLSHHFLSPNKFRSAKKKIVVGVNVQQLSKWVFKKLQEKSEIHKMEIVLRKKEGNSEESMGEKG